MLDFVEHSFPIIPYVLDSKPLIFFAMRISNKVHIVPVKVFLELTLIADNDVINSVGIYGVSELNPKHI